MLARFSRDASVVVTVLLVSAACATAPLAPAVDDSEAKKFTAPSGLSRIYVVRPGTQGGAGLWQIIIDGVVQGGLPVQGYIVSDVAPGKHVVTAAAQGGQLTLPVDTVADSLYFVRIANFGRIRLDSETDGRFAVLNTKRVVSTVVGSP